MSAANLFFSSPSLLFSLFSLLFSKAAAGEVAMGERSSGWRVSAVYGTGDLGDIRAHLVVSVLAPGRGPTPPGLLSLRPPRHHSVCRHAPAAAPREDEGDRRGRERRAERDLWGPT